MPNRFNDFDVFLKLRVLHQLTVWTFWNADRIREKLPEQREIDQTAWVSGLIHRDFWVMIANTTFKRIEELGYDSEDRYYYVLDDNRLYRLTFPPIPPPPKPKPKSNSRAARAMRASKRRRVSGVDNDDGEADTGANGTREKDPMEDMTWECVAVSLSDYQHFLDTIQKTKDPNERILRDRLLEDVMPIIEKEEESQQRQIAKREKELFNMELLAGAKRSSRIAGKAERERHEREAEEAAERQRAELAASRKEAARQKALEQERQSRIMGREERTKERERRRLEHEAELGRISEEQKKLERGESRMSERHLKAELDKRRKNLENLSQEDQWIFDCSGCGVHGENLDDGSHSVACEKCNVWQHSKCLGISQVEAEREDFVFICRDCKRREEEAKMPKLPTLKFRVGDSPSSTGALQQQPQPPQQQTQFSPTKPHGVGPVLQNGSPSKPPSLPPFAPSAVQAMSPERRPQAAFHVFNSSPPRPPFSPSKGTNGSTPSSKETVPKFMPGQHPLPLMQQSFPRRPSSSHSVQSSSLPSPIQNRPSMSPTQGNRDVGPVIAGYPSTAPPNGSTSGTTTTTATTTATPWTPYGQHRAPRPDYPSRGASASFGGAQQQSSFSSATPVQSSPLQSSHGVPFSGISPTKNSPRPITSSGVTGAPILPPIQKLEPSPKLMGRSSPDAPIPAPMKCRTPEQEERRQREHLSMAQAQAQGPPPHSFQGQNAQPSLMSSPSFNRIPPLGPSALSSQPSEPEQGHNHGTQ